MLSVMMSVIMQVVVMLSVIMLNVIMMRVVVLCVALLNVIMLTVIMLNVITVSVIILSVVMLSAKAQCAHVNHFDEFIVRLRVNKLGVITPSVTVVNFIRLLVSLTCGLYHKHTTIVNDDSRVIRMMLQVVASPTIVILMTLELSFMLLENIYSTGITHDDRHMTILIFWY